MADRTQAQIASRNFQALKKKSYDIKFELQDTCYDAIENIGTGAYGVVCSAVHRKSGEKVAIKKIPSIFDQPTIAKRTYREIKILKHFKHDNIIAIREILKPPNVQSQFKDVYIVLDLMESDLHRIIYSKQELSDEHVRYFLYQILRGLKYIHSANVIHRDLKPSNLLINENCDLKIGDFGMARGVSDKPEEYNMMMTQYVATRWYRAPELMMLPTGYSGAVDVWSVGCILAEMLGKHQLFPGRDYMDQLKRIIGILGTPPERFMKLINAGMLKDFIRGLGPREPMSLKVMYPKAPKKALDLLAKMLSLDPDSRISVDKALTHLYLNKYHDADDEPVCVPLFNFDFERQELDSAKLRDQILTEIMEYHQQPTKKVFNLRPVPKGAVLKSPTSPKPPATTAPTGNTGLDAFLQYMAEQEPKKDVPPAGSERTGSDALLQQQLQSSVASLQQLQFNMASDVTQDGDGFLKPTGVPTKRPPKLSTAKPPEGAKSSSTDVEMISAKSTASDVEMLSANKGQPLDAKAQLKAALLEAHLRRQRNEGSNEKPRPVTAQQRQKEREEKRKKKMDRVLERKRKEKKKDKNQRQLLLTDEDKSMLERWQKMQKVPATDNQPETNTAAKEKEVQLPEQQAQNQGIQKQHHATQDQNLGIKKQHQGTQDQNLVIQEQHQGAQDQKLVIQKQQHATQDQNLVIQEQHQGTQDQNLGIPDHHLRTQNLDIHHQGTPDLQTNIPPLAPSGSDLQNPYPGFLQGNFPQGAPPPSLPHQVAPAGPGYFGEKWLPQDTTPPDSTPHYSSSKSNPPPALPEIGPGYNLPTIDAPWPELAPLVSETGPTRLPTYAEAIQAKVGPSSMIGASNYDPLLQGLGYPGMAGTVAGAPYQPVGAPQDQQSSPELLDSVTRLLMKSHVEDLTLAQTPKGTGGGYGVGLDLDAMLRESMNSQADDGAEPAPLSASLIADWLEVSGNMDPKDLEAMQQELALSSPSVFSGILSS